MTTMLAAFSTFPVRAAAPDLSTGYLNHVYVEFNPIRFIKSGHHDMKDGFSVGYGRIIPLSKTVPIYVETGLKAQYITDKTHYSLYSIDSYIETESRLKLITFKLPIVVGYDYSIGTTGLSVAPYVGTKVIYNAYGYIDSSSESLNIFSDKMVNPCKRFQIELYGGFQIHYKHVFAGIAYGKSLTELQKDVKVSITSFTLGYRF